MKTVTTRTHYIFISKVLLLLLTLIEDLRNIKLILINSIEYIYFKVVDISLCCF